MHAQYFIIPVIIAQMRETRWVAMPWLLPSPHYSQKYTLLCLASKLSGDHSLTTNMAFCFWFLQPTQRILIIYKNINTKEEKLIYWSKKNTKKRERVFWMFWILVIQKSIFPEDIVIHLGRRLRREYSDTWLPRCQTVAFHVLFSKCYSPVKFFWMAKLHERNYWWISLKKVLIYSNTQIGSSVKFMLNTVCPLLEDILCIGSDFTEPRRGSPHWFSMRIESLTWVLNGFLVWIWNNIFQQFSGVDFLSDELLSLRKKRSL